MDSTSTAALLDERIIPGERLLSRDALQELFEALKRRGYDLIGPTIRDGAVVYDQIEDERDLPAGWTDQQEPGKYRLVPAESPAVFGYTMAQQSWKRFLFPPSRCLFRAPIDEGHAQPVARPPEARPLALIGVRACELEAILIQDRVLTGGHYADPAYRAARERCFIVAVNCTRAAPTCFCQSMGTGPQASGGFDIALTEIASDDRHEFLAQAGTQSGAMVLHEVAAGEVSEELRELAAEAILRAAAMQTRWVDPASVREMLFTELENPRWNDIAKRCLTCGNCTMVCPTCFCTTTSDSISLDGAEATRERQWDTCFSRDYSYIHGGSVRATSRARYRQWMTHKLASWWDQFGSSGCVGCGRCITWCPAGIDITEEVHALSKSKEKGHGGN